MAISRCAALSALALFIAASTCTCSLAGVASEESSTQPGLDEVLWWFPEDTETLVISQEPFSIAEQLLTDSPSLFQGLQQLSTGGLLFLADEAHVQTLRDARVLLAVEGSRKYLPPTSLGMMVYEGCSVIIVEQDATSLLDDLLEVMGESVEIGGHRVLRHQERMEQDMWDFYIAAPLPHVLLSATDEGYLLEVFDRMTTRGESRALPESLPEWQSVDTTTPAWAIRHFDPSRATEDPTSPLCPWSWLPDSGAVGVTFTCTPEASPEALLTYLSTNPDAESLMTDQWNLSEMRFTLGRITKGSNPTVTEREPGVVEIRANNVDRDTGDLFFFVLLAVLGRAICL